MNLTAWTLGEWLGWLAVALFLVNCWVLWKRAAEKARVSRWQLFLLVSLFIRGFRR